jgi:hypothetical protein
MPRAKATSGNCAFCGGSVNKRGFARHAPSCADYQAAVQRAERSRRKVEPIVQLHARDAYGGQFWLDLEMRSSATLMDLDDYLRAIWLECCGHMRQFSIGGWGGAEIPQSRRAASVFQQGLELTHIYDFGTESETRITMAGVREGRPITARPITLLARNVMPAAACIECGAPASFLCMECVTEHETWGVLCDAHAQAHPHVDYGDPIRLVNSPRMGLCGYTGPAEAPY